MYVDMALCSEFLHSVFSFFSVNLWVGVFFSFLFLWTNKNKHICFKMLTFSLICQFKKYAVPVYHVLNASIYCFIHIQNKRTFKMSMQQKPRKQLQKHSLSFLDRFY